MLVPKIPSFLKVPKHKTFHIQPRYFNPVQEEREKRMERIKAELNREKLGKTNDNQEHIKIKDFYSQRNFKSRMATQRQSSFRVMIIFLLLVLAVYLIFS